MKAKLVDHLQYYAVTDNSYRCDAFRRQVGWLLYRHLNRRGDSGSFTWERLRAALAWVGWPSVKIRHHLCPFRRAPVT